MCLVTPCDKESKTILVSKTYLNIFLATSQQAAIRLLSIESNYIDTVLVYHNFELSLFPTQQLSLVVWNWNKFSPYMRGCSEIPSGVGVGVGSWQRFIFFIFLVTNAYHRGPPPLRSNGSYCFSRGVRVSISKDHIATYVQTP